MLKVENLTKKYGDFEVLKGISFEVKNGLIYGFLGPNGAGKTTTMNILSGLIDYNGGDISINGKTLIKNKRELLKKVGYLPQNPVFYNYMTAVEYLRFIGELNNFPKGKMNERTDELLEIVRLTDASKRKIGGFSGGMKQRLGIAAALYNNPEIILLDEPTAALDPEGRLEVLEFIQKLKNSGKTIFLSTHILNDIERVCDEVSVLDKGKILISSNLENLKNKYILPIFDVEYEKYCEGLEERLKKVNWVKKVIVKRNQASIYVNDIEKAKSQLLEILINETNNILSFNLRKSNLEDIFIRLVNEDVNI